MNCTILPEAELEAAEAATWYESQRNGLGDEFLNELKETIDQIQRTPTRFGALESYQGKSDVRRGLLTRFPYIVVYLQRADDILIVAISHVRRRPHYWLDRID